MSNERKTFRLQLVYIGQRETSDRRLSYTYLQIEPETGLTDDEPLFFNKPLISRQGRAGVIIETKAEKTDDGHLSVFNNDSKYIGMHKDREQAMIWQAEHDAVKLARAQRRERQVNLVHEQLEPLRRLYFRLSIPHRRALLALVIEHITKPGMITTL
jgi:hypothetical protein